MRAAGADDGSAASCSTGSGTSQLLTVQIMSIWSLQLFYFVRTDGRQLCSRGADGCAPMSKPKQNKNQAQRNCMVKLQSKWALLLLSDTAHGPSYILVTPLPHAGESKKGPLGFNKASHTERNFSCAAWDGSECREVIAQGRTAGSSGRLLSFLIKEKQPKSSCPGGTSVPPVWKEHSCQMPAHGKGHSGCSYSQVTLAGPGTEQVPSAPHLGLWTMFPRAWRYPWLWEEKSWGFCVTNTGDQSIRYKLEETSGNTQWGKISAPLYIKCTRLSS